MLIAFACVGVQFFLHDWGAWSFDWSHIFDKYTSGRLVVYTLQFHDSLGWLAQKERNDHRMRMDRTEKGRVLGFSWWFKKHGVTMVGISLVLFTKMGFFEIRVE